MGLGYVAELVGDHIVDCVDWRLNEAAVEQQATGGRHGPPSLPGLAYDETRLAGMPRDPESGRGRVRSFPET